MVIPLPANQDLTPMLDQILNCWHILHVHWSHAQLFILFLKRASACSLAGEGG